MINYLFFALFFTISTIFIFIFIEDINEKTLQPFLFISLGFASFSSAIGTATTTRQWASSLSEKNPQINNLHESAVIWLNWGIIPVSFAYGFYLSSPSWFGEYNPGFNMESLRVLIAIALAIEILIDLWAAKYINKKSELLDRLTIWAFLVTELIVVTVSSIESIVPSYILFIVGLTFSIGHLYGAKVQNEIGSLVTDIIGDN